MGPQATDFDETLSERVENDPAHVQMHAETGKRQTTMKTRLRRRDVYIRIRPNSKNGHETTP